MDSMKATAANGIEQRAKLEQVAKARELVNKLKSHTGCSYDHIGIGSYVDVDDVAELLAAALAACAREEELRVARTIKRRLGEFYYVTKDSSSRAKNFEDWLNEHVAALERAAGESK